MHPANAFQQPQGFPPGQERTLLNSSSFSIVPGQGGAQGPSKYVVNDQSGSPLLWVMESAPQDHGHPNPGRSFAVKDAGQLDVLRILHTSGAQATTLLDTMGNPIGSVVMASKSIKEDKKGKDKEKDKDGKRQIVLQNPMNQALLTMSGKAKHGGGNVEMKIKSATQKTSLGMPGTHGTDHKSKDKDKKDKDKDKKDKDKKGKEVAEVAGSVGMGFQVRIMQSNLNLQERNNIVGLLISYMELEKQGTSMPQYPSGVMPHQQAYYPQQPGMNQGMQPQQGFPGQPFYPAQPQMGMGPVAGAQSGQMQHPDQMGFFGGPQQSGQTFQGQYPPPHH